MSDGKLSAIVLEEEKRLAGRPIVTPEAGRTVLTFKGRRTEQTFELHLVKPDNAGGLACARAGGQAARAFAGCQRQADHQE